VRAAAHIITGYPNTGGGRVEFQDVKVEDITDAYNASLTADYAGLSGTPSAAIANSAISVLANGALQGAGGGQVTIGGLGYTGDLNASSDITLNVRGTGLILSGNSCSRPTGGGNWDADCYSSDAYVGGAACSFVLPAAGYYFMAGLNADPAADTTYQSIDFAFHSPGSSSLQVYESGVYRGVVGTCAVGDVLAVVYDGQFVRYLQNGNVLRTVPAAPGLKFYFDSSIGSGGINNIRFGPYANTNSARGANLIDASWWNTGIAPTSIWASNQGAGTDAFVVSDLPDGNSGFVWRATQDSGADNGGGWNPSTNVTNNFPVNPNKTYMFVCFSRSVSGTAGSQYWGISHSEVCDLNTATPNGNPYFAAVGKYAGWHMHIGWVYPAGSTGHNSNAAGVYNCATGAKIAGGTNFNWSANTQNASTRAYQFYANTGAQQDFVWPMVFLCDGSEPSIDELLGMAAISGRNQITPANASTFIANAAINTAQIGQLDASVITAGSITTDKLVVGAATVSAGSAEWYDGAYVPNVSLYTLVGGVITPATFTSTGSPISIWVTVRLRLSMTNTLVDNVTFSCRLLVNGTQVAAISERVHAFFRPSGYGEAYATLPLVVRATSLPAGSKTFSVSTDIEASDASGGLVGVGTGTNTLTQYVSIVATENKV
jgi:hypothetical protein